MTTLEDLRTAGESQLTKLLAKLDRRHKARVRAAIEQYGRVEDIPQAFWDELQREIEEEEVAAVLLLILAADDWTSEEMGISRGVRDNGAYAVQAARQVQASAEQTVGTLRDRLARKEADMRTSGPGNVGNLTPGGIEQALDDVFTNERRAGIATDQTTRAFSAGQIGARDRTVGSDGSATNDDGQRVTIELIWRTEQDNKVCPRCSPLDGTTEDVWGRVFPEGPGPEAHPNCRCSLEPRVTVDA